MELSCPLCSGQSISLYFTDKRRAYFSCSVCSIVFADPNSWPDKNTEKTEYDLHENDVNDDGYNRFLQRIVEPLNHRIPKRADILDFGCGPAPALAKQLSALNHCVELYDIFYAPDASVLNKKYDAIVLTEVIEHLHNPLEVLTGLWRLLNENGVLAIMTQRVISQQRFQNWAYKNDPTHVCFYSDATFTWLSEKLKADSMEFVGRDMVFVQKQAHMPNI